MSRWKQKLIAALMSLCMFVTLAAGVIFAMNPREWIDFVQVLYLVKKDFREPLSIGHMLDGAIAGLAESAGDKYTYYLTPERNRMVAMASQGYTGAIGVTVDSAKVLEDRLIIREVRPDSGADRAGLKVDDAILRVGQALVRDMTVDEAIALIRGEPDTWVRLLVAREGEEDKEYNVRRTNTITLETVQGGMMSAEYLEDRMIAYIFIDYFAGNSWQLFDEVLDGLLEDGAEGLILDLRYNGGGDVAATSRIAGRLLPDGELMRLVMRTSEQQFRIYHARPVAIPYVILVNGGSASASEILAGAVQDAGAGLLVGTRTYGKGSVQSLYNLSTGSGLRVTEGRYYLPGGRSLDGEGILPDYVVGTGGEDDDEDAQVMTAVRLLGAILDGGESVASLLEKSPQAKGEKE